MTAVHALLDRAKAAGIQLYFQGGRLRYRGPGPAVEALLPELKAHKPELLTILAARPLDDAALADLVFDTAKEHGVDPLAVWRWLSAEDIQALRSGDPAETQAFRLAVQSACAGGRLKPDGGHTLPAPWPDLPADPPSMAGMPPSRGTARTVSPTAKQVTCGECRHFLPDAIGDGSGIGCCRVLTKVPGDWPAYPRIPRLCRSFAPAGSDLQPAVRAPPA